MIRTRLRVREILHKLRPIAVAAVALAFASIAAGVSYQFIKLRADARRFPQEGRRVNIGGYKLNINCTGQGSPTVVLEAGLGVPAISWRGVQAGIAQFTRVCSYDRAGYDWSDPGPMPRTTLESVKELHSLLHNAGEKPPYVMVGHSFGGTNVRIYASRYPGEIAGIVLADTGNENEPSPDYFLKLLEKELERRRRERRWGRLLYWFGVSRFDARVDIDNPALTYNQQEWAYFVIQPNFMVAAASELENVDEGKNELRTAGSLGDKPLIVLIAGDSLLDLPLSPEQKAELNISWIEFEKRLASLSSRGKWGLVTGVGHMLPFDRPEAIVSAAQELWMGAKPQ